MRPSEAKKPEAIRRAVEAFGLGNSRVFESAARSEDTEVSDLDLLVDKASARRSRISTRSSKACERCWTYASTS
jgi:predicted nucleotidyltransferase